MCDSVHPLGAESNGDLIQLNVGQRRRCGWSDRSGLSRPAAGHPDRIQAGSALTLLAIPFLLILRGLGDPADRIQSTLTPPLPAIPEPVAVEDR